MGRVVRVVIETMGAEVSDSAVMVISMSKGDTGYVKQYGEIFRGSKRK